MNALKNLILLCFLCASFSAMAQEAKSENRRYRNAGKLYVYWGWNISAYSKSDIYFEGNDYNFVLKDVIAKNRPTDLSLEYIRPSTITIPQYNARIGYFISDRYSISIGNDHMKYVMQAFQKVEMDGYIANSSQFDGVYNNQEKELTLDFLRFEHTDGLNYENIDFRRHERLKQIGKFTMDAFVGLGTGILFPKTNATLFNGESYDEFNVAGYAFNALLGINISFNGRYFLQTELKFGHANMQNVRISPDSGEKARQKFNFLQYNYVFGVNIPLRGN